MSLLLLYTWLKVLLLNGLTHWGYKKVVLLLIGSSHFNCKTLLLGSLTGKKVLLASLSGMKALLLDRYIMHALIL